MNIQSLRDIAVLVTVSMKAYSPRIMDRAETAKINAQHSAKGTPHKVIRDRLSGTKAGEILADITKAQGEARRVFYERTLPWDDGGRRMASTEAAHALLIELRRHEGAIMQQVERFAQAWPNAGAEARAALNGGWKPEYDQDYNIPADEMRGKFGVKLELESMPNAADLRMDAPDAFLSEMIKQSEDSIRARFEAGCKDAHKRLYETLEKMYTTLNGDGDKFHDSLVGNLRELVDLLPVINISKDPELNRIGDTAKRRLLTFDDKLPASLAGMPGLAPSNKTLTRKLKDDKQHRNETATAAREILADLAQYMGGAPK